MQTVTQLTPAEAGVGFLTTGQLARETGLLPWHVLALLRRGRVAEPHRIGCYRVWPAAAVAEVRAAAIEAGYLEP
jgi:hypothetical protein